VAVQRDVGTSSFLEYIQKQTQGARTVIQHITALRSFTDLIPLDVQSTDDLGCALFNIFNYDVKAHLVNFHTSWKTQRDYPTADILFRAACEAHRFYWDDEEEDVDPVASVRSTAAHVLAIQASPPELPNRIYHIDHQLLQDVHGQARQWSLDLLLEPDAHKQLSEVNKLDSQHRSPTLPTRSAGGCSN
jgi:hypothetical protein